MPLLSDEYYESGDESLDWDCVEVEHLPEPDFSVEQIQRQKMAFRVCRGLVEAFDQAGLVTGATSSEDLDNLLTWAKQALPSNSQ
jgi:hypothetical protein